MKIAGLDEAGVGPLAGPVVAAAALYDDTVCPFHTELYNHKDNKWKDSKQLTETRREALFDLVIEGAITVGLGWAWPAEIDEHGLHVAHKWALRRAVEDLQVKPDIVIVDGEAYKLKRLGIPQQAMNKADELWWQVACASIVAKVYRDRIMREYHEQYPDYGFVRHKGYPTPEHIRALHTVGPSEIHRRSMIQKVMARKGKHNTGVVHRRRTSF